MCRVLNGSRFEWLTLQACKPITTPMEPRLKLSKHDGSKLFDTTSLPGCWMRNLFVQHKA